MDINTLTELLSTISSNVISIKDTKNFSTKLNNIINSYKQNPSNIIFITDFDYTITKRYNYQKNLTLNSSYRFYDESLIGGDQNKIIEIQNQLCNEYMKYETDNTYDKKISKKKVHEFYSKSLDVYINPKLKGYGAHDFASDKIAKMIDLGEVAGKASLKELKRLKK